MDANTANQADQTNLLERESKYVADVLRDISDLIMASTSRLRNSTTTGDAAANGQRIEMVVSRMVVTLENLLNLSHQMRQLLVIGPLRKPGEGDAQAEANIRQHVQVLTGAIASLVDTNRRDLLGPYGSYQLTPTGGPVPASQPRIQQPQQPQQPQPQQQEQQQ